MGEEEKVGKVRKGNGEQEIEHFLRIHLPNDALWIHLSIVVIKAESMHKLCSIPEIELEINKLERILLKSKQI